MRNYTIHHHNHFFFIISLIHINTFRIHDLYIGPIQGAMYKAPGTKYAHFGIDRRQAITELINQFNVISSTCDKFDSTFNCRKSSNMGYLCGTGEEHISSHAKSIP